jgi:rhamnosyltransferase
MLKVDKCVNLGRAKKDGTTTFVVLIATYNGGNWLVTQLDSIIQQENVKTRIIVSDDCSNDETLKILDRYIFKGLVHQLPTLSARQGSAAKNFYRLIRESEIGNADYVAFSDQDDVWMPNKLSRAASVMNAFGAAAYSCNVEAFWSDGRRQIITKAQPQKRYDYFFSSPGPGCTFVLRRNEYLNLKKWIQEQYHVVYKFDSHDWLVYAFFRHSRFKWFIDDYVSMGYRQHGNNEFGANIGLMPKIKRIKSVMNGMYFRQVKCIAEILGDKSFLVPKLERFSLFDRIWFVFMAGEFRRYWRDVLVIRLLVMFVRRPYL